MKRSDLSHVIRETLKRLPRPYEPIMELSHRLHRKKGSRYPRR